MRDLSDLNEISRVRGLNALRFIDRVCQTVEMKEESWPKM